MYPYAIYAAVFFSIIPYSVVLPLTALFAESLGATYLEIGLISSSFSIMPLLLAVRIGRLIDRYGGFIAVVAGLAAMTVALVLPPLFPVLPTLFVSQALFGAGQMVSMVAFQNAAAFSVTPERRDRSVANFFLFSSAGLFIGPLAGGYLTEYFGYQATYFTLAFIVALSFLGIKHMSRNSKPSVRAANEGSVKKNILPVVAKHPILLRALITGMVALTSLDLFYVYFSLIGSANGLTASQIGWVIALEGIAYFLVRFQITPMIERFGYGGTLFGFIAVCAIAYSMLPFFGNFYVYALLAFVIGCGLGISQPITMMIVVNYAPNGRAAEVLGLRIAGNRLAQLIFPAILSAVGQLAGLASIFILLGLMLFGSAVGAKGIREAPAADGNAVSN